MRKIAEATSGKFAGKRGLLGRGKRAFSRCCDDWLADIKPRVKPATYAKYSTILRRHILPAFGGRTARGITESEVSRFARGLTDGGLAAKTARDILAVLNAVLAYAAKRAGAPPVRADYPKREKREMRVLTREEQSKLTAYLLRDLDPRKFGVLLALWTGLRLGEACALKWRDISASERTVTVSGTMARLPSERGERRTEVVIGTPKTADSARVIPLTERAAELCERMRPGDPEAFVLTGESGRYIEPRALQYRFARYAADCGLEGVHFHTLRHTFATRCVEAGFEMKSLSEILGHSSPSFTLERYVHSSMDLKRQNMEKLSSLGL